MAMPDWVKKELRQNYAKASRAGREAARVEPRAASAAYLPREAALSIALTNGISITIPTKLIPNLTGVTPGELREVEVSGRGGGLYWETLDLDLSVPALIASVFDSASWMAELGRIGGRRSSPSKAAAARKNGRKGGRPRLSGSAAGASRR